MDKIYNQVKYYDSLTGLPNMAMFHAEVCKRMEENTKNNKFAIAYLDIDNFRYINEALGYKAGNDFLKYIAKTLKAAIRETEFMAHFSGDQFAILITDIETEIQLVRILEQIKKEASQTWSYCNMEFNVSISMGIVTYPDHGQDVNTLLQNADIALYAAKKERNRISFYKEGNQDKIARYIRLINDIQTGISNKEFMLYYQPQVNLTTKVITGVEALIRWNQPKAGFIPPSKFIPAAEESNQISLIEKWVIHHALEQKKQWENEGITDMELSVNLSGKTLENGADFKEIETIFASHEVDFSKVVVEVTETAAIFHPKRTAERLNRLKKFGVKIALDDFGTGCSSLSHLKELPIDIIKLDKSFIDWLPQSDKDTAIIKNIITMAYDLNYRVIAEGIETPEQLECLKTLNCQVGQGYLLGVPLPDCDMTAFIQEYQHSGKDRYKQKIS